MHNITRRKFLVGTTKSIGLVAGFSLVPNILSAKEAINMLSALELEKIFKFFGEENEAKKIANQIIISRKKKRN